MREDVTDTSCKQWVEDCQLRSDVPGDPVPRPPHPDLLVGIVLSMVQGQVTRAVREEEKSQCSAVLQSSASVESERVETQLGTSSVSGPHFKRFIYRKFSGCGG